MSDIEKEALVKSAFGAKNRTRLIGAYFSGLSDRSAAPPSHHVYRLLLWVDQTTGLAHCYESDKCQPGKPWYARSLAFHDWASRSFGLVPAELAGGIDWLFRQATGDLAAEVLRKAQARLLAAERQRKAYEGRGMPAPGEDPELVALIRSVLGEHLTGEIPPEKWRLLVQRIREYLALENKRKNLVGEGFEDVIAASVRRSPAGPSLDLRLRAPLAEVPGFDRARQGEKPNKVDLAIVRPSGNRVLVTAKWSVRADREKQFAADYSDYVRAESSRRPFDYVFVTNEFDPARLMRACEHLAGNSYMFASVVHISPDALRAAYGDSPAEESMKKVADYISSGRLVGLDAWLESLVSA